MNFVYQVITFPLTKHLDEGTITKTEFYHAIKDQETF